MADIEKNKNDLASMSLGDHLEELRSRLIMIIVGVFVGLLAGVLVGKQLILFLEAPYDHAVERIYKADSDDLPSTQKVLVKFHVTEHNKDVVQSLKPGDSFLAYMEICGGDPNDPGIAGQYPFAAPEGTLEGLKTIKPSEGFVIYLKVCLVFGIVLSSPWIFWQIWSFVSAGLYRHERKFIHVVSPVSALLFIIGCVFFLLLAAPNVMYFFIKFDSSMGAESNWTLQYYMDMVLLLTLVFGLAFQSPIAIVFAERMGLVSVESLASARRYVFLGCFVISAMVTPPDPVSQISLAVPLYILYEGSMVICRVWRLKRQRKD